MAKSIGLISLLIICIGSSLQAQGTYNLGSGNYLMMHSPSDQNWRFGKDDNHNINIYGGGTGDRRFRIINGALNRELFNVNFLTGFTGIGTDAPRGQLEVRVNGDNNTVQTGLILAQTNPTSPNGTAGISLDFGIGNNWVNNNIQAKITVKETYWSMNPKMTFSLLDAHPSNTMRERMVIDTNGNVGIGTESPTQKLDAVGRLKVRSDNNNTAGIWYTGNDGSQSAFIGLVDHLSTSQVGIFHGGWRFIVNNVGNVGIGTLSPDAKLAVKGTVHAEEVKVDLSVPGPDYVFEENYNLPSLTETESYIKQNKHLPEVPSAKDMETNGINLSEMNMILLKKVEELTLHLIEQEKRNNQQSIEIENLKAIVSKK